METTEVSRAELRRRHAQRTTDRSAPLSGVAGEKTSQADAAGPQRSTTPSLADVTPFATVLSALGAVPDEPPTRRSRRTVTVGGQTTITRVAASAPVAAPAPKPAPVTAPPLEPVLVSPEPFELLEPPLHDAAASDEDQLAGPAADPEPASVTAAAGSDPFQAAAQLFSFTGELPIQSAPDEKAADGPAAQHVAPRRSRAWSFQRITATSFSVGVMGIVGLLTVGLTTPADALAAPGSTDISASPIELAGTEPGRAADEIQAYVTPSEIENATIERAETYSTLTMAQLASQTGISNYSNFFMNDPSSPIQWPFAVGVPISYGFGMRDGKMHEGADFTPGEGAPIQAIADGVVRESTESGGAFGVHIVIDHVIDGQLVSSSYSHLQYGSRLAQVGDHVTVGTIIGRTGNTGRSFGAHTHFEMLANGTTPIDPIPWLRAHAGG